MWKRETYGFQYKQLYDGTGRYENSIPHVTVQGYASFRGATQSLLSPTTDIAVLDNLSWVKRAHAFKTGVAVIRNRKDQNGRPAYAGDVNFSSDTGNPNRSFQAFADALLGHFRTYSEADSDPVGFFRFSQYEAYVSDNWKLHRKLSMELGLRYQYGIPTYTQGKNLAAFSGMITADPEFENRRGAAGVGILEGPRYRKADVSLRKWFQLNERVRMQFQGDMFNMFNNTNFNNPTVNLASLDYGRINSSQSPRQVQLALRLTF